MPSSMLNTPIDGEQRFHAYLGWEPGHKWFGPQKLRMGKKWCTWRAGIVRKPPAPSLYLTASMTAQLLCPPC